MLGVAITARNEQAFVALLLTLVGLPASGAITPDDPGPADVRFSINSAHSSPISPYIYGMNSVVGRTLANPVRSDRLGGNRWTGYNWETNASNAGSDYLHQSDNYLVGGQSGTAPGAAVRPSLLAASASQRALVVTVPTAGYVAADAAGPVSPAQSAPSSRWRQAAAKKASVYPGSSLDLNPNTADAYTFTDEFVHWVETNRQPGQPVFYSLDNEPGLWNETHARLHAARPTFAELRDRTVAHAGAIKDVNPEAVVLGGVGYGWNEFRSLQNAPDAVTSPAHPGGDSTGELHYYEWLLQQVAAAETAQGRTLMDAIDLHWYPEARGGGVRIVQFNGPIDNSAAVAAARVQAPRSLWDPTFVEDSWITNDVGSGPIRLLPHLQRDIDDFKPGTKIAVTEYNFGGENHISGAIAEADVLGIFGREQVFAANFWHLHSDAESNFVAAAFNMYLNFDGAGSSFGNRSIEATTSAIDQSAIYASLDAGDASRMVLVAINRTDDAKEVGVAVTHDRRFDVVEAYQLTEAGAAPVRAADIPITLVNAFRYTMPPLSVSTLVLRTRPEGDFNGDGAIDSDDLSAWRTEFGATAGAVFSDGDNDRDADVDGADFLAWQRAVRQTAAATRPVSEPASLVLVGAAALRLVWSCARRAGECELFPSRLR